MKIKMKICPKCGDDSLYTENDGVNDWLRCRCGLMLLLGSPTKTTQKIQRKKVKLPGAGSMLYKILLDVAHLGTPRTGDIFEYLSDMSKKSIVQYLSHLEQRGLLKKLIKTRTNGGSTWGLTDDAKTLIKDGKIKPA
jgi:hypothetical protein